MKTRVRNWNTKYTLKTILLIPLMLAFITAVLACNASDNEPPQSITTTSATYTALSTRLINVIRAKGDASSIIDSIAQVDEAVLSAELTNDDRRKTFWINVYNAYIQLLLLENPELHQKRNAFFNEKRMVIAGKELSFDDIEHGIIRRSKVKLSLGLFSKWRVSDFEKQFRCDAVDPRVHFALNCGAKSCPPIAALELSRINKQLDASTRLHLQATSTFNEAENTVYITTLFSWFRGDFGNKDGIRKFLKQYDILPKDAGQVTLSFTTYDWTLLLDNYVDL